MGVRENGTWGGPSDQDVVETALAATIEVHAQDGLGSGFVVEQRGLAVTARHVVDEGGRSAREVTVRVFLAGGQTRDTTAVVFNSHRYLDYALLWLAEPGPYPTLSLGNPGGLRHTDVVFALGSPSGLSKTASRGIVSNPRAAMQGIEYIQTDAAISGGNSGGPLIDRTGHAMGINVLGLRSESGSVDAAHFAVPLDYLWSDIKRAWERGREACINAPYCRSCGHTEYTEPTWYCRACGLKTSDPELDGQQMRGGL